MRLTAQVKLQPTPAQADALLRTLEAANEAANWIAGKPGILRPLPNILCTSWSIANAARALD